MASSESSIIKGLRDGESHAFDWVYKNCFSKATTYVLQHQGSNQDAEDFFQEALFVLVQKLRTPGFELTSSCSTFLYAIVRNLWLYHQRKAGRVIITEQDQLLHLAELAGEDYWHELHALQEQDLKQQGVLRAMEQLGDDCRQLLLLTFYENKNEDEIAQTMNYQRGFVKVKRFRCLSQLKKILGL